MKGYRESLYIMSSRWKNAFKIKSGNKLTKEEEEYLSRLAEKIRKRSLADPVMIFLESTKPIHHLGSQAVVFCEPLVSLIVRQEEVKKFAGLMENPTAVDRLIEMLADKKVEKP